MKKSSIKSLAILSAAVLTMSFLFTGCGEEKTTPDTSAASKNETKLSGQVTVSGSTSVQPLAQILAEAFMDKNKDVTVDVQAGGSSTGVKNANDKVTDIGNSSRELKTEEKDWGLTEHVIAIDGIAVVVNPKNKVDGLTKDQIVKIFKGEITNWKDVGGEDKEIVVVTREPGSGTRGAFEEILKLIEKVKDASGKEVEKSLIYNKALVCNENGVVKATVASAGKEYSIGYMSLGYVDESVKAIKVDNIEATIETIKAKTYPIARPFLMLTKGELSAQVKAYIDFVLGAEGQDMVEKKHYIRVDK